MHPRGQCDTGGDAGSNETARQRAEPGPPGRVRVRSLAARGLAALLLVAVAACLALPHQAQAVTLVSTLGQNTDGQQTIFVSQRLATKFTVGPDSGYTLTSVTVKRGSGGQAIDMAIHAVDTNNSNNPADTALYSFTRPSGNASGNRTFTAPTGATLTQDTSYFVVMTTNASGAQSIPVTNANGEDAGGITGWSVANSGRKYDGSWGSAGTLRMKLEGEETAPNSAPTFDDGTSTSREFNETIGDATVTTASDIETPIAATDTNTGDTLEYSLGGTDAAKFGIISTSGQIQTKVGEKYSYETDTSYAVTVTVDDNNGGSDTIDVTLDVADQNEPPIRPDAPGVTGHSTDVTKLLLTLTRPNNTDRPNISGYKVRLHGPGSGWSELDWITTLNRTVAGANSGVRYTVQYRARNNEGEGPWSPSGFGSTKAHATGVPDITGTAEVAETLTAGTSGISDGNGKSKAENGETGFAYTYQWVRRVSGTDSNISGATSRTYTLTAADEGNKVKVKARFTDNAGYAEGPLTSSAFPGTGTVAPEPDPVLSFANSNVTVGENAGPATVTVELDRTSTATVTVDFATSDLGIISTHATAGEDYTASSGTLAFTSGQTSKMITIPILNDDDYEQPERFRVTLSNAAGATLPATPWASVSIVDDETVPRASLEDVTVDEGAGTMTLTLRLSHPSQADINYIVNSSNVEGTATKGDDYEDFLLEPGGTAKITVPGGELSQTFDITIVDDSVNESDETIDIGWLKSLDDDVTPITLNFLGTITDNDTPLPELSFPSGNVSVDEEAGPAVVTVNLDPASTGTVTVDYATRDSTAGVAKGGEDYTATSGTLTFAPGETSKTITIEILGDDIYEGLERFVTELSSPSGATLPQYPTQTVEIISDEAVPAASMAPVTVDEGAGTMTLTLRLSHRSQKDITYAAVDGDVTGTATEGDDYDAITTGPGGIERVTVQGGDLSQTFDITIVDDDLEEADETIEIVWQKSTSDVVTPEFFIFTGTIEDNDEGAGAAMGKPKITGAAEVGETLTVNTSGILDQNGNTKAENGDAGFAYTYQWYRIDAGTETPIAGANGRGSTYTLAQADEGKKFTVEVSFTDDAGNSEGPLKSNEYPPDAENGELRLVDDNGPTDAEGRLEVFHKGEWGTVSDDRLDNPGNIAPQFACQLMGYATGELVPRSAITNMSVAPASQRIWLDDVRCFARSTHWTGSSPTKLHQCYHAGWGLTNSKHEEDVHLSCSGPAMQQTEATGLTAAFEDMPASHDGSTAFTFRLTFSEDVDISAADLKDHALTVTNGTVTTARALNSGTAEWDLTIQPTGTGPVNILVSPTSDCAATGALCTAAGTMLSTVPGQSIPYADLVAPVPQAQQALAPLTAGFVSVPPEHDGQTAFWLELSFNAAVEQGSKPQIQALLGASGGSVTKVRRKDDRLDRWRIRIQPSSHAAVTVTLSPSPACGATGTVCTEDGRTYTTALATRINGPVGISVADTTVQEGPNAQLDFVVSLSRAATSPVTVAYRTRNGTALAGQDYTDTSGTVTFAAGDTARTVTVPVLDDVHDEGSETMKLKLANASGGRITDRKAIGTITNSDPLQRAWLSRFGRTVGTHVTDAVGERLRTPSGQASQVTVGGYRLPLGRQAAGRDPETTDPETTTEPETTTDRLASLLTGLVGRALGLGPAQPEGGGLGADPWADQPGTDPRLGQSQLLQLPTVRVRDVLLGSSFRLALAGDDARDGAMRLTAWGRVTGTRFDGRDGALSLDGDVLTGTVGIDGTWGRWLLGLAAAHTQADGTFAGDGMSDLGQGALDNTLTSIHPYVQYAVTDRLNLWGMVGYGWGDTEVTIGHTEILESDTNFLMGAVGGRGVLLAAAETGGFELATRSDAMLTQTSLDDTAGMVGAEGEAHRLRVVLEGSRGFTWPEGRTLTPTLEVGLRHDWGDAETGFGLEVGGRVQYADPRLGLTVEGTVRGLVAHEASEYDEWGASANVRLAPGMNGQGLSLTLAPTWGAVSSGVDGLWSRQTTAGLAPQGARPSPTAQLNAEIGYGIPAPFGPGLLTPYAGTVLSDGAARTYRLGTSWTSISGLTLNLEAQRQEPPGQQPINQALHLQIGWGF